MPRKKPPHVEQFRDRHGRLRTYFRRGHGRRVSLPPLGAADFDQAYERVLAGILPASRATRGVPQQGTIEALVISYLRSSEYFNIRNSTKKSYSTRIEVPRREHGYRTVSGLTRDRIVTIILRPYADRPGAAHSLLKMLRILIRHAIQIGWLSNDPSIGIKRPRLNEIRSWSDEEIESFRARWLIETRERLALELFLGTGQRISDVHRMTWADIKNEAIRVTQQKTGERLEIPLSAELRNVLARAQRKHVTIINTAYGKPFTVAGFSRFMRDAITSAGLPLDCKPHGLRKAAGRVLAEAGCTTCEIMSILGHRSLAEAERYTRGARQALLARSAIAKVQDRT